MVIKTNGEPKSTYQHKPNCQAPCIVLFPPPSIAVVCELRALRLRGENCLVIQSI